MFNLLSRVFSAALPASTPLSLFPPPSPPTTWLASGEESEAAAGPRAAHPSSFFSDADGLPSGDDDGSVVVFDVSGSLSGSPSGLPLGSPLSSAALLNGGGASARLGAEAVEAWVPVWEVDGSLPASPELGVSFWPSPPPIEQHDLAAMADEVESLLAGLPSPGSPSVVSRCWSSSSCQSQGQEDQQSVAWSGWTGSPPLAAYQMTSPQTSVASDDIDWEDAMEVDDPIDLLCEHFAGMSLAVTSHDDPMVGVVYGPII
ncbi:MAG: hypothetical protein EXX96DRAFT_608521 [Benjaminiella poitrasii]|nr:MAG: hypothetical protein EXX96DRAFT_608521 [Benjaminiella poitrasii]